MILRARAVLPVSGPVLRDGAVRISGQRITAVGRWRDLSPRRHQQVVDLGDAVLLPGLVNAHCHLDYTQMAGQFPPPKVFTDWLKVITATKAGWNYSDYADSWRKGARMLLRTGTTTVADIEAVPQLLPEVWELTPLRVISFLEMIGISARRPPVMVLEEALEKISALGRQPGGAERRAPALRDAEEHRRAELELFAPPALSDQFRVGLSPHAPYSTVPELLRRCARAARRHRWRVSTHLAESALEFAMFTRGEGEMADWLSRAGRDMSDCGLGTPVQHLERCGLLGTNLLAIHANYLGRTDATLLGRRGVSVVHCPRSHSYFRHDRFPLRRLARAGVNLCLGTDSLASVYKTRRQTVELNMFDEMRALADAEPSLSARTILRMVTRNGARALGMQGRLGELAKGAFADIIALPFNGKAADAYETVLAHQGPVTASLIGGRWAMAPGAPAG